MAFLRDILPDAIALVDLFSCIASIDESTISLIAIPAPYDKYTESEAAVNFVIIIKPAVSVVLLEERIQQQC